MPKYEHTRAEYVLALDEAIKLLDKVWDFDAERGLRDGRGGVEYEQQSHAPALRELQAILKDEI